MSGTRNARDTGPALEPATERVRSGVSARGAAVGAAILIVAVGWFGMSGRRAVPTPPSSSPAAMASVAPATADAAGAPPAASPPAVSPSAQPAAQSPPPLPTPRLSVDPRTPLPPGDDFFAVTIVIEERVYFVPLREYASGQFAGEIGLRFPAPAATDAELELVQLWTRDDSPNFRPLATYPFRIGPLLDGTQVSSVVLDERRDGRRRPRDAPRLLRTGYELTVRTETQRDRALLVVEVAPLRRSAPTR